MFYRGTALFTQQKRASPDDGLITQSTRARGRRLQSPTNEVLFSVVYGENKLAVAAAFTEGKP